MLVDVQILHLLGLVFEDLRFCGMRSTDFHITVLY